MNEINLLEEQAIEAAVNLNWQEAIRLNMLILKKDERNMAAHLRLGYAYMQNNEIDNAENSYKDALKIQPKNHIATDNLERLAILRGRKSTLHISNDTDRLKPDLFLEIPGKTKTIQLVTIGQKDEIASLVIGQTVELKPRKRKIEVRTKQGAYIGTLPDDLSRRMMYLLQENSIYKAHIKEATLSSVVLFVREIEKGENVQHIVSFPQNAQMNIPLTKRKDDEQDTSSASDSEDDDTTDIEEETEEQIPEVDKDLLRYRQGQDDDESDE